MRLKGTLVEWNDDRGFGFIEAAEDGGRTFCHIKAFEVRVRRPMAGDSVTFEVSKGADGRVSATRVRPVGLEDASYQPNARERSHLERARRNDVNQDRSQPRTNLTDRWMRKIKVVVPLFLIIFAYTAYTNLSEKTESSSSEPASQAPHKESTDALSRAYSNRQSNVQVQGAGVVQRILSDDSEGSRHQRFIVRLSSGQTVLIAHNIDLAPRVAPLAEGDRVEFSGEYEWNDQGGVVHWTHSDPNGRHAAGWIRRASN